MRSRGFTLIEMLVVMVLIGVIVSLAVVSISDDRGQQLEREARRLATVVELAAEEAVLKGRPIGLQVEHDRYGFAYWQNEEWVETAGDRHLRNYELPEPMYMDLTVEGIRAAGEQDADKGAPQVLLMISGEITPFEIRVRHPDLDSGYLIRGELHGRLSYSADE